MYPTPNDLIQDVLESVQSSIKRNKTDLVTRIIPFVIGYQTNSWGDVTDLNDDLRDRIVSKIDKSDIDQFEARFAEEVIKKLQNPQNLDRAVNSVVDRLVEKLEDSLINLIYDSFESQIQQMIEKELKERYAAWFVANRLKK